MNTEKTLNEALITAIEASFEIDPYNPVLQNAFEYNLENSRQCAAMLPAHASKPSKSKD